MSQNIASSNGMHVTKFHDTKYGLGKSDQTDDPGLSIFSKDELITFCNKIISEVSKS